MPGRPQRMIALANIFLLTDDIKVKKARRNPMIEVVLPLIVKALAALKSEADNSEMRAIREQLKSVEESLRLEETIRRAQSRINTLDTAVLDDFNKGL